jgi:N6-L-threonylcarbamoyladenine synthase
MDPPKFPFLTLLVSGGHSLLLLATSSSKFEVIADTVDNSIGYVSVVSLKLIIWSHQLTCLRASP